VFRRLGRRNTRKGLAVYLQGSLVTGCTDRGREGTALLRLEQESRTGSDKALYPIRLRRIVMRGLGVGDRTPLVRQGRGCATFSIVPDQQHAKPTRRIRPSFCPLDRNQIARMRIRPPADESGGHTTGGND
jgi:hypothetical protein